MTYHAMGRTPLSIDKQDMDGQQVAGKGVMRVGGFHLREHRTGDRLRRAGGGQSITCNRSQGDRAFKALREELVDKRDAVLTKIVRRHWRLPFAGRSGMMVGRLAPPADALMAGFPSSKPFRARMVAVIDSVQESAFGIDSASNAMPAR
jgi:hypothetical protein